MYKNYDALVVLRIIFEGEFKKWFDLNLDVKNLTSLHYVTVGGVTRFDLKIK